MNACVHRLVLSAAVATTLTGVSLLAQGQGHKPPATFRSSVDLVSIQASVKDRRGRPVKGLTTADFEVRDNGLPRPILSMRSDQTSAVSLAILVDMSGSMRVGPKMAMARQAFDILVGQLRQGEDEVALFTFDSSLHERHAFTSNFARSRRRARRSAPVRQHLAVRRHCRHRAASVGTPREPQGDRHPDRRHRHEQRA